MRWVVRIVVVWMLGSFGGRAAFAQPAPSGSDPGSSQAAGEPAAASRYPRDVISRPLTYPAGVAAVGLDLSSATAAFADPAKVRLLAGYGISDDVEINFGHYQFPTNDVGKGSLDAGLGWKLVRGAVDGKLEVIARAQTGYDLGASAANPLLLGAHVQYNVTPSVAIITPGGQLAFGLHGDNRPITFALPVSLGIQVTPVVYVQADTQLALIKIANATNAWFGADATPLAVSAYVNVAPPIDVFAGIGADLTPAAAADGSSRGIGDTAFVIVGGRYYVGAL